MRTTKQHLPIIVGLIIVVAAGILYSYSRQQTPAEPETPRPGGYGSLPTLSPQAGYVGAEMSATFKGTGSAVDMPTAAPMPATDRMTIAPDYYPCPLPLDTSSGSTRENLTRPAPCPPQNETRVAYEWTGDALPEAPAPLTVWKSKPVPPSAGTLSFLAGPAGKLFAGATVNNFSARDADNYVWNIDIDNRTWNFWSNEPVAYAESVKSTPPSVGSSGSASGSATSVGGTQPSEGIRSPLAETAPPAFPPLPKEEAIGIARAFFEKRGVSFDSFGTAQVEEGYYPTVYVPYRINDIPVIGWDGMATKLIAVTVNPFNKTVSNGFGTIDGPYDALPYPAIASDEALKQILTGGMHPYAGGWWYGRSPMMGEAVGKRLPLPKLPTTITVGWERAELAYLFMNSYENNRPSVYLIPVYLFHGKISGEAPQEWRSWVPAVPQQYFGNSISGSTDGSSGLGSAGAMPVQTVPMAPPTDY